MAIAGTLTGAMLQAACKVLIATILVISTVQADCDSPPIIQNAGNNVTEMQPYPEGTAVLYHCNAGFSTKGGSPYYICNENVWTDGKFLCEKIFCSNVKPPENGYILNQPTNEAGTSIKFGCNTGHDLSGADMMLCQTDGKWQPPMAPKCTAKNCGEFESIQNADTFQENSGTESNHYGSVIEVTCKNGSTLIGPPRVKCEANGQWGERPKCEILNCPTYLNTTSACVRKTRLNEKFYFVICEEGISTRVGPQAAECKSSGEWDSPEMACICDCIFPDYAKNLIQINNLNEYNNLPHNATLQWTCTGGSSISYTGSVICTDGKLKALQDDVQVTDVTISNLLEINRQILSKLCYLPTTVTAPTTEMTSSALTSTLTESNKNTAANKTELYKETATGITVKNSATIVITNAVTVLFVGLLSFI